MRNSKKRTRVLNPNVVTALADAYIDSAGDPDDFGKRISSIFPDDEPLVLHWYHPNLESFVPVLRFGTGKLVWDVANELIDRWGQ
jgi:hypothetical protein